VRRKMVKIDVVSRNKKAKFDYEILEKYEAGLVLLGDEVKALRARKANLNDSFCRFIKGELWLLNAHIAHLETTNRFYSRESRAPRKLLLHKRELLKLFGKVSQERLTIIPLEIYFNRQNRAKVLIALAKGKKLYDKRETLKRKTLDREAKQAMKNRAY
jgi:SsrA-binding protein